MSFQSMTWAVEQELPAMQKIVLLMLANRTNHDSGLCFPSHDRLAKDCGMSARSVIRQIEKLEEGGFLAVIREIKHGVNLPNKYRLNMNNGGSDRVSGGVVTECHTNQEFFNQEDNLLPPLAGEMKDCFDWAVEHPFWSGSVTSINKFLELYGRATPNGLKAQYQKLKQNEASNATHQQPYPQSYSKPPKLTPAERVIVACGHRING